MCVFMSDVFGHAEQLPKKHVGLVFGNQGVDFLGRLAVVKIPALQGNPFEEGAHEPPQDLQFSYLDEIDGLAIGLQGMESVLLVDFWVVVERTKDDFIVLCELLYLVESSQLVTFFKRVRDAGQ